LFSFHLHHGENFWGKEHHPLANAPGRLFTYDVEDAGKEHIMFQRSNVQHAAMEKPQPSASIRGELEISIEREPDNSCASL